MTAKREMALAFDGGVTATVAGNSCRRAAAAERVVGVPRTPNRDATRTTLRRGLHHRRGVAFELELSSDAGGVGSVGEADKISYREGGENATQDSPTVRVYIEGR